MNFLKQLESPKSTNVSRPGFESDAGQLTCRQVVDWWGGRPLAGNCGLSDPPTAANSFHLHDHAWEVLLFVYDQVFLFPFVWLSFLIWTVRLASGWPRASKYPQSIWKYLEIPQSTWKYIELPQSGCAGSSGKKVVRVQLYFSQKCSVEPTVWVAPTNRGRQQLFWKYTKVLSSDKCT